MPIPKIIHYCWFGGNRLPKLARRCIASWKKFCPDYEITRWDESNFDVGISPYCAEAHAARKYAFVSDFVRVYVLYNYGGIYMDTDVELLKPLDQFLNVRAFTGSEGNEFAVTGIMGAEKKHPWVKLILDEYCKRHFLLADGSMDLEPNTVFITKLTSQYFGWVPGKGLQVLPEDVHIYEADVFCPLDLKTGKINLTERTCAIHHFSGSWVPYNQKLKRDLVWALKTLFGEEAVGRVASYLRSFRAR